jgi:hypothetical protein
MAFRLVSVTLLSAGGVLPATIGGASLKRVRTQIALCLSTWIVGTRVAALAMGLIVASTGNPFAPAKALLDPAQRAALRL